MSNIILSEVGVKGARGWTCQQYVLEMFGLCCAFGQKLTDRFNSDALKYGTWWELFRQP